MAHDDRDDLPDGLIIPATVRIDRLDGGPTLVIAHPGELAYHYFSRDPASVGPYAYDDRVGTTDPGRITRADITNINTTMRARSPIGAWAGFLDTEDTLAFLTEIPLTRIGLFEVPEAEWPTVRERLDAAITALLGPYRNLAVVTKVLHAKRPLLFPILDRLVVEMAGGTGRTPAGLLDWFYAVGRANHLRLGQTKVDLEKMHLVRTEVRILDALLWVSHPATSLPFPEGTWERRMEMVART